MTVHEVAKLHFMDAVTDKPDWNRKVFDEDILDKWRTESTSDPRNGISLKAFDWCITELRDRASVFEKDGLVRTLEGGVRIVKSDVIIDEALRMELCTGIRPLLDVDNSKKDWHPNSNQQVLNIVHPSLYPLIYGRSQILEIGRVSLSDCAQSCGQGTTTTGSQALPDLPGTHRGWMQRETRRYWSNRFQWLPAEIRFTDPEGTNVEFTSYINNLYPKTHRALYTTIAKIVSAAVPAWNEILVKQGQERNDVRIRALGAQLLPSGVPGWTYEWNKTDENSRENLEYLHKFREYMQLPDNLDCESDDVAIPSNVMTALPSEWVSSDPRYPRGMAPWDIVELKYRRLRRVIRPEPGDEFTYEQWVRGDPDVQYPFGTARDSYTVKLEDQFRDSGLQVIVKLASIELTSEKPNYAGGSWHVEGMLNEHIVGTAIFYFDTTNCTGSRLRFRQESSLSERDLVYEQDDHDPLRQLFGTSSMRDEPAVQEIGSVDTRQGRLVVFPNTLQHLVEPFRLIDETKPGHRRLLVLWLVDPHYRVASTANVPPQQVDWLMDYLRIKEWNRNLPIELQEEILKYAKESTMTLEEARSARLELMAERTAFTAGVESNFGTYNLCEH